MARYGQLDARALPKRLGWISVVAEARIREVFASKTPIPEPEPEPLPPPMPLPEPTPDPPPTDPIPAPVPAIRFRRICHDLRCQRRRGAKSGGASPVRNAAEAAPGGRLIPGCIIVMASKKRSRRRWSGKVKTVSTAPPPRTFAGSAEHIARTMARKRVSPKGIGSGIRMIQFFINRAGKDLLPARRRTLERAKRLLQARRTRSAK